MPRFGYMSYIFSFRANHSRSRSVISPGTASTPNERASPPEIDRAIVHRVAEVFPGIAKDHHAAPLHHEAGECAGIAADDDGAAFLVDSGAGSDRSLADQVAAAESSAELGAGIFLDDDGARHHVLAASPADAALDCNVRAVNQTACEISARAFNVQI